MLRTRTSSSPPGSAHPGRPARPRRSGQGLGDALERQDGGTDEELEADERRTRVPGQAEHERPAPNAERDRLARLDRDAPEHLLDAELRLDPPHEVVRPDRDAAGGDEDVRLEPARERARWASSVSSTVASRSTAAPASASAAGSNGEFDS